MLLTLLGAYSHYVWCKKFWWNRCSFIAEDKKPCAMRKKDNSEFCKKHAKVLKDDLNAEIQCKYHLPIKDRRCRMQAQANSDFCAEHMVYDKANEDRVPCPLDNKHTVARDELEEHLAKCNSRVRVEDPWIKENYNCVLAETKFRDKIDLKPTQEDIDRVTLKIPIVYATFSDRIGISNCTISVVEKELLKDINDKAKKHLQQISSIVGNLTKKEYVSNDNKFAVVDFGGGRGEMAYYMAKEQPGARVYIVERSGVKNKFENRLKKELPEAVTTRLRCSIEHLDMSSLPGMNEFSSVSFICKHFCGSAFDGGLRCMEHARRDGVKVHGFVLVPCCVHKCPCSEYCGMEFVSKNGFESDQDFAALRHIASWAHCGFDHENAMEEGQELSSDDVQKMELGRQAKMILHWGRAEFLRSLGYEVDLVEFCSTSVTPENIALIGRHSTYSPNC